MFSQLGPLFKVQFRQAESNDTRQYIPHEERDKNRKKQEEQKQTKTDDTAWTDDASVSVLALRRFLIDFLKTLPGSEDYNLVNNQINNENSSIRPKEKNRPTNTYSAKAVRAYQTMATHAQHPADDTSETNQTKDNKPTADKLASKEIREIHGLITDLETLEKKGVTMLNILKAESFVEGMKRAIQKELQNFKK